eukprot:m.15898 g.15898  ORF g.15898 m.15898 type:complete len:249 (-) comp10068_c0_seq1:68-814(-)
MLVLVRHGESEMNKANKFCGWLEAPLTLQGISEAHAAAALVKGSEIQIDACFTSVLSRAVRTLWIMLEDLNCCWLPVVKSWRLNERQYGQLTGKHRVAAVKEFGLDIVKHWRRAFDGRPPPLDTNDPRLPAGDRRYADISPHQLPLAESLHDVQKRMLVVWREQIVPLLHQRKTVLIVSHGNLLRSLVMFLDGISKEDIMNVNVPTGIPLVYQLDEDLNPTSRYYLGDESLAQCKANTVANQLQASNV